MESANQPQQLDDYQLKPYGREDSCDFNPDFAVICSFISRFSDQLDLDLNIEQLKDSLKEQDYLNEELVNLHVKLLKKTRRYFVRDQWEKALIRFAAAYSYEDAYELETLGYLKTRPSIKLELLKRLLDAQFECDQKFKAAVNAIEANELRVPPTGRDINGNTYWHEADSEGNIRVFYEHPLDYQSWKAVCLDNNELDQLIKDLEDSKDKILKGQPILQPYNPLPDIFPEIFGDKTNLEACQQEDTDNRDAKKGRSQAKHKCSLKSVKEEPVLERADEEPCNIRLKILLKEETRNDSILQHTCILSTKPPIHKSPANESSIESQVISTLDLILNRVSASLKETSGESIAPSEQPPTNCNESKEEQSSTPKPAPKKRQSKKERFKEEAGPRRTSSRIQQLQMKKIAEQEEELKRLAELKAAKKLNIVVQNDDDSRSGSSSRPSKRKSDLTEEESNDRKKRRKKKDGWKRGKDKKKLSWDQDDSDLSSTSSPTESNDDFDDDLDESFKFENYDDEFACEDEETNMEPVIVKRARTARQNLNPDDESRLDQSSVLEEDRPCRRCDKSNDPEWILLCDMCDDGYHTSCCLPPLMMVPDGDWFCPSCEHKMLLTKLKDIHENNTLVLRVKERERAKCERLRQTTVKKAVIKEEAPLPAKRQADILTELNDSILLQELDEESEEDESAAESNYSDEIEKKPSRNGRGRKINRNTLRLKSEEDDEFRIKKRPRKTYSRRQMSDSEESDNDDLFIDDEEEDNERYNDEDEADDDDDEHSCSSDELKPKARRARASVSYRFKEYDELIKSAIQGDSYDEEEDNGRESENESEACNYGKGKDMATIEALAYQQENGLDPETVVLESSNQEAQKKAGPKSRKKGRRLNDLDAASESGNTTSDESFQASSGTEAEDDDLTEADLSNETETSIDELIDIKRHKRSSKKKVKKRNSYDSDDSDWQPSRTRRVASMKISYRESSGDEEEEAMQTESPVCPNEVPMNNHSSPCEQQSVKAEMDNNPDVLNSAPMTAPESTINCKMEFNGN